MPVSGYVRELFYRSLQDLYKFSFMDASSRPGKIFSFEHVLEHLAGHVARQLARQHHPLRKFEFRDIVLLQPFGKIADTRPRIAIRYDESAGQFAGALA